VGSRIGEWPEAWRIREAVLEGHRLLPWQARSFLVSGSPWPEGSGTSVTNWPKQALVCNCMGVTRGLLELAIEQGYNSVDALKEQTKAGTGCGSCLPLLAILTGNATNTIPVVEGASKLTKTSAIAMLLLLLSVSVPALAPLDTALGDWNIANLWLNSGWQQFSGYCAFALSGIAMIMSLRKHWNFFSHFSYPTWRIIHTIVGVLALLFIMVHTGLAFGYNLDRILLIDFFLLSLLGAISGSLVVLEGRSNNPIIRYFRNMAFWGHVLLLWPLPVLLAFHILTSYYF